MLYYALKNRGYDTQKLSKIFFVIGSISIIIGIISNRLATRGMDWRWFKEIHLNISILDFSAGFFLSIGIILLIAYLVFRYKEHQS